MCFNSAVSTEAKAAMRATMAATLMIVATTMYAQAQPGGTAGSAKNKPAAARPPAQTPADTVSAMAPAALQALQSDLAWTNYYNGLINGEVSDRLIAAIKAFQNDQGGKQTGVLNPQDAAFSPRRREKRGRMSAGRSPPIPLSAFGWACRRGWCRSNRARAKARNGVLQPARSRSSS
jgi:peptidoglycan hydrolase-like protein with peptidoglycan-binding domain